jgi:uncharacterized repeat protein (TIGR01451 family)
MMAFMLRLVSVVLMLIAALPAPPAAGQVVVGADLRAQARAAPDSVAVGDDATLIATVENQGPEQATDVTLSVALPDGLVAQAVDAEGRPCSLDAAVTCHIGPLAPGASAQVRIMAGVTRKGALTAAVTVGARQDDPVTTNNEAAADLSAKGSDCGRLGTPGPDELRAPKSGAVLCGLGGDDVFLGGPRGDELVGGSGNDTLVGDAGRDRLDGGDGSDACAGAPGPGPARRCEHAVFALAQSLPLVELGPATVGYGYHQSLFRTAIGLRPFEPHVVMGSRNRGTGSTTAADIVVGSRARIHAPVSGRIVAVERYLLYCERPDWKVVIKPEADPSLRVLVLHMGRPAVQDGDRVVAGASKIGRAPPNDWADSQTNGYFPAKYPHVHVEVERDRASPTPGCSI